MVLACKRSFYILYFQQTNKTWFNPACSFVIHCCDVYLRNYHRLQTPETHATFNLSQNRAKFILRSPINLIFLMENIINFLVPVSYSLSQTFFKECLQYFLTTAVKPSTKAELFTKYFFFFFSILVRFNSYTPPTNLCLILGLEKNMFNKPMFFIGLIYFNDFHRF